MRHRVRAGAIGCGCLLGAAVSPLQAAEWSAQPTFSWSVDHDSNRSVTPNAPASDGGVLSGDLRLRRTLETLDLSLEPRIALRRYSDPQFGDGTDMSVAAGMQRSGERNKVSLTGSVADQSTLTTELAETGIVRADTHRHNRDAAASWSWAFTERREWFAQLGFSDVNYTGQGRFALPGYRYSSASLGQRFVLSERSTLALSAFGDALSSERFGSSSHEIGGQVEYTYSLSERNVFDASVGESQRYLAGVRGHGTDISASFTRDMTRGNLALSYTRSLVPYGIGFLVERQQIMATVLRPLNDYLDATISLLRVHNNQSAVELGLDRRSYDTASAGLHWHLSETWMLATDVAASRAQPVSTTDTVHQWRAALTLTWNPNPTTRSR